MNQNFNNPKVQTQSWYIVCKSSEIKITTVKSFPLFGKKVAIYRTKSGIFAMNARCPHLGADLGKGKVVGNNIKCSFHHWEFGCDGECQNVPGLNEAPKRRTITYPTQEKWGYVWIWNGPEILFDLPNISGKFRMVCMPTQTLKCHPHIMIANGLDTSHFSTLHNMELEKSEMKIIPPFSVEVTLKGRPLSKLTKFFIGASKQDIDATFKTIGGNIALAIVKAPVEFVILFTGNTSKEGGCNTHTIAFLPKRVCPDLIRAIISMFILLRDDRLILDNIEFCPGFVETDTPFIKFIETVNQMKTW